jgi:hypothetical protein
MSFDKDTSNSWGYITNDLHYGAGENTIDELTVLVWGRTSYSSSNLIVDNSGGRMNYDQWSFIDFDRSEVFNFYLEGGGQLAFSGYSTNTGGYYWVYDLGAGTDELYNDGEWHLLGVTFSVSNQEIKFYADGVLKKTHTANGTMTALGSGTRSKRYGFIAEGSEATSENGDNGSGGYTGDIAALMFYDSVALTDAEIETVFLSQADRFGLIKPPPSPFPPPPSPRPPPPSPHPPPSYSHLGEGECRQSDGNYPIKFSKGYSDLREHTSGTNAQQAMDRCKAKCIVFAWCLAAEVVLRDIWPTPECRLVTDWNAYVVESTNTFQNNEWGGMQSIDGENYQTYCNGGSSPCSSSNVFNGGSLNSREGYYCYIRLAPAPPAPLPPPPSTPSPPPPPPDPDYSYLGEGECRMANGQYSISFHVHASGSVIWCKDLCLQYTWCLASQYQGGGCKLVTDTEAFITTGGNTFTDDNDKWGATRTFDDKSYTTYCGGGGVGVCRSVTYEFSGGLLYSRSGYHCYVKK